MIDTQLLGEGEWRKASQGMLRFTPKEAKINRDGVASRGHMTSQTLRPAVLCWSKSSNENSISCKPASRSPEGPAELLSLKVKDKNYEGKEKIEFSPRKVSC